MLHVFCREISFCWHALRWLILAGHTCRCGEYTSLGFVMRVAFITHSTVGCVLIYVPYPSYSTLGTIDMDFLSH